MSDARSDSWTPRHKRPLIVGTFVVLLIATSVAFAVTTTGYVATEKAKGETIIVGTVSDYRFDDSADEIVVEITFENPTMRPYTLESVNIDAIVNDTVVAQGQSGLDVTVPAGATETITLRMQLIDGQRSTAIEAIESGRLSGGGTAWARIERFRFQMSVTFGAATGGDGG